MYMTRPITDSLTYVGADDRRLAMFEGVYSVPRGVSYNAYLLTDERTALFDTVDKAVGKIFFENLAHALGDRRLDYVVVSHMEPDHSATLAELLSRYPDVTVIASEKALVMMRAFGVTPLSAITVKEGDALSLGTHTLRFVMAPMVHWPEVMVTFEESEGILFSADAFGTFGALSGRLFADEVDFMGEFLPEARRYYTNIVGKYGPSVSTLLGKAAGLDIKLVCPLHGFVFRAKEFGPYLEKYKAWATYTPEEKGVLIAYASIYGNTENAAVTVASRLAQRGVKTQVFDVSVTPASEILSECFRFSHLVFASSTYNAGVFVSMDALLRDVAAHNLQNRTFALIENGSWAPSAAKGMREILSVCKNMTELESAVSVRSAVSAQTREELIALADALAESVLA
ncbi:MAG: FprA family A-type flavoprotein [Clostridia bacterium]|nr:FprA family A-type flavoprotein [Clostridia bacterium]